MASSFITFQLDFPPHSINRLLHPEDPQALVGGIIRSLLIKLWYANALVWDQDHLCIMIDHHPIGRRQCFIWQNLSWISSVVALEYCPRQLPSFLLLLSSCRILFWFEKTWFVRRFIVLRSLFNNIYLHLLLLNLHLLSQYWLPKTYN